MQRLWIISIVALVCLSGFSDRVYGQLLVGDAAGIEKAFRDRGEVQFKLRVASVKEIQALARIVSIDRVDGLEITAYANRKEMEALVSRGYAVTLVEKGPAEGIRMAGADQVRNMDDWDYYPTYDAYVQMMVDFEADYPQLCKIVTIAILPSGRKLLAARISDNVQVSEAEPQFLYTSSMHGNETTGYVLMLRLIDYLLTNYGMDASITELVDQMEIWINPLANPDGTYAGGNNSVAGATRYNANGVDLNRNYPDPEDGPHPDGNDWQPETMAFMEFASIHHFVMGANFHGGTELVNYPWDTWPQRHADDDWWMHVSNQYADTVHAYSNNYFYGEGDGVTNGYDWYTISGGRQDYMTYFHHGRECTIEISDISLLPAAQLPVMWEYNYRSLLNYMKQACLGLSGVVTDSLTGEPLKARILIEGHDFDSSHVYSSLPAGNYHRLLYQGSYDITVRAPGYFPKVLEGIGITNGQPTVQDVQLVAGDLIAYFSAENTTVQVGSSVQFHDESSGDIQSWYWVFEGGDPATSAEPDPLITYTDEGEYDVTLTVTGGAGSNTFTRSSYIHSAHIYSMQNGTASVCSGKFFDSGGPNGHYGNYQNLVMTLYPAEPGKRLRIVFVDFNMEYDPECSYDYLRIFDGTTTTAPLIGEYCGYLSPGAVEATSASGALTFFFHSDGNVTAQGWEADISCETIVGMETPGVMEPEIYPNPAGDRIRIKNGASAGERVVYRIYTNDGIPVFEEEKWTAVPEDEIKIPPLPGGIYILQIIAGERIEIKKIVLF